MMIKPKKFQAMFVFKKRIFFFLIRIRSMQGCHYEEWSYKKKKHKKIKANRKFV